MTLSNQTNNGIFITMAVNVTYYNDDYGFPDQAEYEKQSVAKSNLLTMDDIDKRKREDEAYYNGSSDHSWTECIH